MVEGIPDVCTCGPDAPRAPGGTAGVCPRCGKPIPPAAALPAPPAPPAAPAPPLTGADPNLGIEMILMKKGWATLEQIQAGRRMQEEELAKGRKIRIGEALVELKILTPERVKEALLLQDKIPMRCVPCGKTFNVRGLKPGSRALCTTCKTPLVPAGTGAELHVEDTGGNVAHVPVGEAIDPSLADLVPGYRIERRLGSGGMGEVYLARQKSLDRLVAIKVLSRTLSADPAYVARFLAEARSAARLSHENVVSSVDSGESKGSYYFIMEYVQGETLEKLLEREKVLPERRALEIARQIAAGLWHASQQSLIHRDIKPANIMVTPAGVAKICDFGLARDLHSDVRLTQAGFVHTSPAYASPEQCKAQSTVDQRTDMYSLGVTLFEMLTGRLPFQGDAPSALFVQHATKPPPRPREFRPEISAAAETLVLRLLRKEPERRFKDYGELLVAITEALHTSKARALDEPKARTPASAPASGAAPRLKAVLGGAVAAAVVAAALLAFFLSRGGRPDAPVPSAPPAAHADTGEAIRLLAEAKTFELGASGPSDYPAVRARWIALAQRFRKTPEEERFAAALRQFDERIAREAEAAAQEALEHARVWEENGALGEALASLGRFPKGFEESAGARRVAEKSSVLERLLEDRFRQGREAVAAAIASERLDEARLLLDQVRRAVSVDGPAGPEPVRPSYRQDLDGLARKLEEERVAARKRELELARVREAGPAPAPATPAGPRPDALPSLEPARRPRAPERPPRRPVPAAAAQKESEKAVRDIFKDDLAKRAAADRVALAKKMLALAAETKDDPAGRYILLRDAKDLFAGAGAMASALEAADLLAAEFELEARPLRTEIYLAAAQGFRSPDDTKTLGLQMLHAADEALAAEDLDGAGRLAAAVGAMARKAKDVSLVGRAEAKVREVSEAGGRKEKYEKALTELARNPGSAEHAQVAGRYLCGVKEDWAAGLPLLAKGTEAALRELALRDLQAPADPKAQVALGDDWWDLAEKEQGLTREAWRRRAASWYEAASAQLTGFSRVKADRRVAELRSAK